MPNACNFYVKLTIKMYHCLFGENKFLGTEIRIVFKIWLRRTIWKNEKTLNGKIIRQINSLVIYLVKPLLSRNFCQKMVRVNFRNFHSVSMPHSVEKREILSHLKDISSNQLFSNLFSKTVTFTKSFTKMRQRKFP